MVVIALLTITVAKRVKVLGSTMEWHSTNHVESRDAAAQRARLTPAVPHCVFAPISQHFTLGRGLKLLKPEVTPAVSKADF